MYGYESKPSKIYSYGCLAPTTGLEAICGRDGQIWRMHRYRNALCELALAWRETYYAVTRASDPDAILPLEQAVESTLAEMRAIGEAERAERSAARSKRPTESTPAMGALKVLLGEQSEALRKARSRAAKNTRAKRLLKTADNKHKKAGKKLRRESGLFWGNYLAIEQAASSMRSGTPPEFRRWEGGEGKVAIQIQKGMTPERLLAGKDSRLRLRLTGEVGRGGRPLGVVSFRIGSEKRRPVWCEIPVVYHRDLPEDCLIKWAYLHRRRTGAMWRWDLSLVVSRAEKWEIPDAAKNGSVGIDVGFRKDPDGNGIEVATWKGSDGAKGRLVISAADVRRWTESRERRSGRDITFDAVRDELFAWAKGAPSLPEWFLERTESLYQWRSQGRMKALLREWQDNRFDGDAEAYDVVAAWKRTDDREYNSEAGQDKRAVRWRDDFYRVFVAGLRRRYRTAKILQVDYADVARWVTSLPDRTGVDEAGEPKVGNSAKTNRVIAAPGRLVALIREGFAVTEEIPRERASGKQKPGSRSRAGAAGETGGCGEADKTPAATRKRKRVPLAGGG